MPSRGGNRCRRLLDLAQQRLDRVKRFTDGAQRATAIADDVLRVVGGAVAVQAMLMLAQLGDRDERQIADGGAGRARRGAQRHDLVLGEGVAEPVLLFALVAGEQGAEHFAGSIEQLQHGGGQVHDQLTRTGLFEAANCDLLGFREEPDHYLTDGSSRFHIRYELTV